MAHIWDLAAKTENNQQEKASRRRRRENENARWSLWMLTRGDCSNALQRTAVHQMIITIIITVIADLHVDLCGHATADIKMLLSWCMNFLWQSSEHKLPVLPLTWPWLSDIYCSPLIFDGRAIDVIGEDKCNSQLEVLQNSKKCPVNVE